jgi:hypothetical protein
MPCGSWGSQTCSNARVPFLALRPAPHDQPVFCFFLSCLDCRLARVGPVVFGAGGDQRLYQCGVQRRLCAFAGVCRRRAHGGANRFEPAAIPFAGFVVHGAGAAGLRGVALAAGGRLAHGLGLFLFSFNLYARHVLGWDALRALVPWGGVAWILAWLVLAVGLVQGGGKVNRQA